MNGSHDVVVIGGGPAGTAAATFLQRHGHRCVLLDRSTFPRYMIGESLIPHSYGTLSRLGLLPKLQASHFTPKFSVRFVPLDGAESRPFFFSETIEGEAAQTWQVERSEFDQMCLEHAAAEVHIDEELVRALLSDQHPALAEEPLTWVDEGWDNVTYRVGPSHAVRIPRRQSAVELLLAEQRWLPMIARWLPMAVPRPVGLGVPSERFGWPWSVVEWIPGRTVDLQPLTDDDAGYLARVLRSLHRPAPAASQRSTSSQSASHEGHR